MTSTLPEPQLEIVAPATISKVSIVVSKGSLEGVYPGLIMANGARMEGIEANLFFTFFGLDAIHKARHEHIKLATVGNPGLHLATWAGGLPGVSSVMTHYMAHKMGQLDIPSISEFIEMIADTGAGLYACQASVDLFGLTGDDFIEQVKDIITVGEFYDLAGRRPDHLHVGDITDLQLVTARFPKAEPRANDDRLQAGRAHRGFSWPGLSESRIGAL